MKKFLIVIFLILFFVGSVSAKVVPFYSTDIKYTGIGVLKVENLLTVYSQKNTSSKILDIIKFDRTGFKSSLNERRFVKDVFPVFLPEQDLVFVTVSDDADGGWFEVVYSQNSNLRGWVKSEPDKFYTWLQFYNLYGKKYGVHIFKDTTNEQKYLYSDTTEESQIVDDFVLPKYITMQILRGNWMLVRVLDIEKKFKIGWIRWRTDDGKFLLFPDFK